MGVNEAIFKLVAYAEKNGLIEPCERVWAVNSIFAVMGIDGSEGTKVDVVEEIDLQKVLDELTDDAYVRGLIPENTVTYRDLFDTKLMGRLTPRPAQVIGTFM